MTEKVAVQRIAAVTLLVVQLDLAFLSTQQKRQCQKYGQNIKSVIHRLSALGMKSINLFTKKHHWDIKSFKCEPESTRTMQPYHRKRRILMQLSLFLNKGF